MRDSWHGTVTIHAMSLSVVSQTWMPQHIHYTIEETVSATNCYENLSCTSELYTTLTRWAVYM